MNQKMHKALTLHLKVYFTWQSIQQMHKNGRDTKIKHLINQSRFETVYRDKLKILSKTDKREEKRTFPWRAPTPLGAPLGVRKHPQKCY